MKNVNKVQYEELTEEQIKAARKRRQQEMCARSTLQLNNCAGLELPHA